MTTARTLLTAVLIVIGFSYSLKAWPQASYNDTYTQGVTIDSAAGEGANFFLYNIETGMFLTDGMDWGTHATVDHAGRLITFASTGTNTYSLYTQSFSVNNGAQAKAGYMTTNGYLDTGTNDANWVFTPVGVSGYTNAYTIKNSDTQYLFFDTDSRVQVGESTGDAASYWLIIPMSTRHYHCDYTYYLQNTDFNRPWDRPIWTVDGTWTNHAGGLATNRCAETYRATFDLSQTINESVPNATYKLYAQGFARNDGGTIPPVLYANTSESALRAFNAGGEGTDASMNGASTSFSAGYYVNNVTTTVSDNTLKIGIKGTDAGYWTIWDNFVLKQLPLSASSGDNLVANQWYAFEINSTAEYSISSSASATIYYTQTGTDGCPDLSTVTSQNVNTSTPIGPLTLFEGTTLYVYSSAAVTLTFSTLPTTPATAGDMSDLSSAISLAVSNHTLGFEDGEYAPYNNVAAIAFLEEALSVDTSNPAGYTHAYIAGLISALNNASWTANVGEVNAIYWSLDGSVYTSGGEFAATGFTNNSDTGRLRVSANPSSNTGLGNVSPTMALWLRFGNSTTYGTTTGYTMPLKASTNYKMTFKYGGWGDSSGTPTITISNPNGTTIATKTLTDVVASHNANNWTSVAIFFETDAEGNYTWSTTSQDGHRPAYAELSITRATTSDLPDFPDYSATPMNADVKSAYQSARTTYQAGKTFEGYATMMTRKEAADASIAVYEQILALTGKLNSANQIGDIPAASITSSAVVTNYTNGVYETLDDVISTWKTFVSEYWNANATANANMTAFILNQGFEMGDLTGWTLPNGASGGDGSSVTSSAAHMNPSSVAEGSYFFHTWWSGNPITQTLTGLPDGTYRMSVRISTNDQTSARYVALTTDAAPNTYQKCTIDGNGNGDAYKTWQPAFTFDFVVGDGAVTIGVKGMNADGTEVNGYMAYNADDFRLTYLGGGVVGFPDPANDVDTSKPMNAAERTEYTTARTAYTGAKTATNYVRLVKARETALVSIDAYEDAKNALDSLQALMTNTNVYTYEAYSTLYGHYEKSKTMYDHETMGDTYASNLYKEFFGNRGVGQKPVPVVPFLASAWMAYEQTSNSDYSGYSAEDGNFHCNTWSVEGDTHDYWVPFMEYWSGSALTPRTLQATVKTTTGSSTLSLTGKLRVMTDGSVPTHVKMRIYSERTGGLTEYSSGTKISNGTITWTRVGSTNYYVAEPTITDAYADEVDENGDGLYDLHIQFIVEDGTNVSWLAFKNLKYTGTGVDLSAIRTLNTNLGTAIAAADTHKLGFGEDEYAPYTNVEQLVAKTNAEAYKTIIQSLLNEYDAVPRTKTAEQVIAGVNYALSTYALRALQAANESWTQNAEEMNGIYWTSNYTTDDIKDFVMYDDEGTHAFRTIEPSGWDLAGRHDAYSTRMNKLGVNTTQDTGLVGVPDSTCLMIKFDTNYGMQPGYTLPLLPNTKYALVFLYTNWEDRDKEIRKQVDITIENSASNSSVTPSVAYYQVAENEKGNFDAQYWKLYTATFTTQADYGSDGKYDDYVITFTKNREYTGLGGNGQLQVAMADFYLLRCLDDYTLTADGRTEAATANIGDNGLSFKLNNGSAGALSAPPSLAVTNVALKRTFNSGAWNSLVLPFNMTQSQATEAFHLGGDTRICYYVGATFDDDEYMACRLRFKSRPCGIMANVPIIIWGDATNATKYNGSDAAHTLKQNLVVLKMPSAIWNGTAQPQVVDGRPGAAQGYDDVVEGDKTPIYNYVGTYKTVYIPKHGVYFTNSTDNTYKKSTAGTTRLRPTRAYFKDMTVDEYGESHVKLANFSVDDIETGIMAIEEDGSLNVVTGSNIYSLDGKLVRRNATTLDGLRNGLYIMNGKKYLVK